MKIPAEKGHSLKGVHFPDVAVYPNPKTKDKTGRKVVAAIENKAPRNSGKGIGIEFKARSAGNLARGLPIEIWSKQKYEKAKTKKRKGRRYRGLDKES
jgi:hypothetical protein